MILITGTVDPGAVRRWLGAEGEPTEFRAVTADPEEKARNGKRCRLFIHDPDPRRHYELHVFPDGLIRMEVFRGN